jgi:heme/copper-type cytochrome/quinol oxidase subunit 1
MADAYSIARVDQHGLAEAATDHRSTFFLRWFCSTNHKDIGTLYLILAICSALVGGALSVVMRMQLMYPAAQCWPTSGLHRHDDGARSHHSVLRGDAGDLRWVRQLVCAAPLEWTLSSPPPFHSYEELPRIGPEPAHA